MGYKEIEDISSKSFEVILSSEDTKQLRLGSQNGSIILTDAEGQIKTVANNIPFEVTTAIVENEYQEIDLRIPQASGVDIMPRTFRHAFQCFIGRIPDLLLCIGDTFVQGLFKILGIAKIIHTLTPFDNTLICEFCAGCPLNKGQMLPQGP